MMAIDTDDSMAGTPAGALASVLPIHDEDITAHLHDLTNNNPGKTLLPSPLAKAVSIATRSTSLALRMGTIIGGYGFDAAKITTLSSLELGRTMLEGILGRAGRDVIARSGSEMGRADAENLLERSLENLHRTMTQIVFWTTTGFHMTGTTMAMVSESSQLLLSTLDQFFGSTDSSRAMASIITLIRREFQHPATGIQGEKVGVADLMLGLCGLAYLQRWCRRLIEEENRRLRLEETVWDVVVLNDGARVDVHAGSVYERHSVVPVSPVTPSGKLLATIEDHGAHDSEDDRDSVPEMRLKRQIMRSLPDNAHVSITTRSQTTKTITVDITGGTEDLPFSPPPGLELVEESRERIPSSLGHDGTGHIPPSCRVVYRLQRNKERRTSFQKEDGDVSQVTGYVEEVDSESQTGSSSTDVEMKPLPALPPPIKANTAKVTSPPARRPSSAASVASTSSTLSSKPSRIPSPKVTKKSIENTANQKKLRMPLTAPRRQSLNRFLTGSKEDVDASNSKPAERKTGFRGVLRRQTSLFSRDDSGSDSNLNQTRKKGQQIAEKRLAAAASITPPTKPRPHHTPSSPSLVVPGRQPSLIPRQTTARVPPGRAAASHSARPTSKDAHEPYTRCSSRASYISVHERRRDSMVSQTDTYSIAPAVDDYLPISPGIATTIAASVSSDVMNVDSPRPKSRLERETSSTSSTSNDANVNSNSNANGSGARRARAHAHSPSIYTLKTNESQTTLVPFYQRSVFSNTEALGTLRRAGLVEGMFPRYHLLRNITRYMRFASASYGSNFLKVMGIAKGMPILRALDDTHHELRSFAHHTQSHTSSILLSSFVDPQGGSDATGATNTGVPLVHYISLDHESKAVVLACRGTLGFEDVLADMTCDYDDLVWRGGVYKVHKGIHASARRLLYGGDGRVLYTLKQALEEYPDYGLVLTGHSLGGAVTALLGVMLSEPSPSLSPSETMPLFITSPQPHTKVLSFHSNTATSPEHTKIYLPSGRPVHVYAYGPPSTMSASLCHATRGLITSIINGNDLVPYLSLGVLHDFQAVALAFKTDNNEAKGEVRQRIWDALQSGFADRWYGTPFSSPPPTTSSSQPPPPPPPPSSPKASPPTTPSHQPPSSSSPPPPPPPSSPSFSSPPSPSPGRPNDTNWNTNPPLNGTEDEQWAYAALKVLRASMMSHKLLPPGEVFVVECTRVLRRDRTFVGNHPKHQNSNNNHHHHSAHNAGHASGAGATVDTTDGGYHNNGTGAGTGTAANGGGGIPRVGAASEEEHIGRPAQRIVLKYVRDVEKRFREVRFGTSMLTDHSPGKYEDALNKLRAGVMDGAL